MNDKAHINKMQLNAFKNNSMSYEERISFLKHIGSCNFCSDQFAAFMSEDLITAPRDLKQNILKAVRQEQMIKSKVREASKRMQLFLYSLKVGAAAALALVLLFFTVSLSDMADADKSFQANITQKASMEIKTPITSVIRDGMDAFCNDILNFSNSFLNN